jgi:putative heme-binding domain-containing protein
MVFTTAWALATVLLVGGVQTGSPPDGDPAAIQAGASLFRERCADCHGADAKGVSGPDLTRLWATADADQRVLQTIRSGIPGTIMPASSAPDPQLRAIVAYLRSISTSRSETSSGNAASGEGIFAARCATCHRVNGRGGRLGPDLSRIPASQNNQLLTRAIRDASASFTSGYEPITLTMRDGRQIRGTRKGEDVFSIQLMDARERLQGYLKADLREVTRDKKSLMPDFTPDQLNERDLNDVLAYLGTLRVSAAPRRPSEIPADQR